MSVRPLVQWSPTALKNFENCARKYHEVNVLKKYKIEKTEQLRYGDRLHKAADGYIKTGVMAKEFAFMQPVLDAMLAKEGTAYGEQKFALNVHLQPRKFFDNDVWVRGVADMLILNPAKKVAWVVDWKTGNDKYPDRDQLELMALMVMAHHPTIEQVNAALFFVLKDSMIKEKYARVRYDTMWQRYRERVASIEAAHASGVWNPQRSGLCGWCEVTTCEFNPKG